MSWGDQMIEFLRGKLQNRLSTRRIAGRAENISWNKLLNTLLIGALIWAPIPLGSNRPWAWSLLAAYFGALIVLWGVGVFSGRVKPHDMTYKLAVPAILLGIAIIWSFVQISPWTPASWHHPAWQIAAETLAVPLEGKIAIAPSRIWQALLLEGAAIASFFIAFQAGSALRGPYWTLTAIATVVTVHAVYALAVIASGPDTILWYGRFGQPWDGAATSTFVNTNNFGTYLGLGLITTLVLLHRMAGKRIVTGRGMRILGATLIYFLAGRGGVVLAAAALISTTLILTQSVGAISATAFGLMAILTFAAIANRLQRGRIQGWVIGTLYLSVLAAILMAGFSTLNSQVVARGGFDVMRADFYEVAWRAMQDATLLGYGPGSFPNVYQLYTDQSFPYAIDKAHNDYLEMFLDRGLLFGLLWIVGLAWPAVLCTVGLLKRRRRSLLLLTGVGVTAVMGSHALIDFSLQIPAVAITFAAILGVCTAHAFPHRNE